MTVFADQPQVDETGLAILLISDLITTGNR